MPLNQLQLNWLRTFESAGRHLSFSEAARELNLSQSAVSQQMKLLESRLGKALFKRQVRSLQLTTEGRAYLEVVRESIDRLSTGVSSIFGAEGQGTLEVSVNNSFGELWLAPRIGRFLSQHPHVAIKLLQTNWDIDYDQARAGLEIRYGQGGWTGLRAQSLLPHLLRPYCSLDLAGTLRKPEGFGNVTLIEVLGTPTGWRDWLLQHAPAWVDHLPRIHVDSYAIAASMAIEGAGVCLLYDDLVTGSRVEPFLVSPLDAALRCDAGYFMTWPGSRPMTDAAASFANWLELELAPA
ncbi:MAG: LysR family transcriptional regulator [Burkholderiaceae bacterium]